MGKNFSRVPIESKEIEGIKASSEFSTQKENLVHICDRDGDVYELVSTCMDLGTNFVIRAVHSRGTARSGVKSFARLSNIAARGNYTLQITSSQKRAARKAKILVRFYRVKLVPPIAKAKDYDPVEVYVVSAKECKNKRISEKEHIDWKLLTNIPVESFADALEKIQWYQARWNVEIFFKTLKSGFGLEKSRFRSFDRMKKFAALVSVVAWKIFWLAKISRSSPAASAAIAFTDEEKMVTTRLSISDGRESPKYQTLNECVNALAALGGYLNRKSDPPPGNIVL